MNQSVKHPLLEIAQHNLEHNIATVVVRIIEAKGSTPRDKDAIMLVCQDGIFDTIGGGQLEWLVTQKARSVLGSDFSTFTQSIPLGPEINQCCGGRIDVEFSTLTKQTIETFLKYMKQPPNIYVFGAGHTGTELVKAFSRLPVNIHCVDTRADFLQPLTDICKTICTPLPEQVVRNAPSNSCFIILTHEHAQDFLLTAEALKRQSNDKDIAYIGMIGSATKRATLNNWLENNGYDASIISELVCPIGKTVVKDKQPAVIAAFTVTEILQKILI